MAIMNISVSKEDLPLITNVQEQSNDCKTVFTFDIQAYPGDPIEVKFERAEGRQPYDKIERKPGGTWEVLADGFDGTIDTSFNMNTNRVAKIRLHIGNTEIGQKYNATRVTVTNNNRKGSKSQFRVFTRHEFGDRCGETQQPPQPTLYTQNYMWFENVQMACQQMNGEMGIYYTENSDFYNPGKIYIDPAGTILAPGGIYKEMGPLWINWTGSYVVTQGNC